ncbi:elongator complex protein 4-like [Tubulanus polymorphus]|uniref:elongator complex protein 4-like n=1 Tax=Tubulanus polymorphus TaxID=672921 RepID=UPI003DA27DEF
MATTTSFRKRNTGKNLQIRGTRPSLKNNQLLVSTGVPSFDHALGGGLAVGTVLMIGEDTYGSYSKMLLKYFLAEGVMSSHALFVASASDQNSASDLVLKELPGAILDDPGGVNLDDNKSSDSVDDDKMKIAWRYEHLPQFQGTIKSHRFGHYYDLTKSMDAQNLDRVDKTFFEAGDVFRDHDCYDRVNNSMNPVYHKLLTEIKEKITTGGFCTAKQSTERNILRIGVHSLGSPLWGETSHGGGSYDASLPQFLLALRGLMRTAFAVCVLTIPTHIFQDAAFTNRLESLCDTAVCLESFTGSEKEKNPAFKEYHGLFHIKKLPRLNSLQGHIPESNDMAFKLHRKKLTIETLHLPPELSETTSRSQEDPAPRMQQTGCGATGQLPNKLDF